MNEPYIYVVVVPFTKECVSAALVFARDLRKRNVPAIVDSRDVRAKKKLQYASKLNAYYAVIIGPDEIAKGTVMLRDLDESSQKELTIARAMDTIVHMVLPTNLAALPETITPDRIMILT